MTKYLNYNLKHLRESYQLTQMQLCTLLGIPPQLYNRYETGRRTPSLKMLYTLANLYNISLHILVQCLIILPERYAFWPRPQLPKPKNTPVDLDILYANLRHNLQALRESHCLSQAALAERLFITPAAYGHYETGRRKPPLEALCLIAEIYCLTLDELLTEWM